MKNKPLSKKGLLLESIVLFVLFLLWGYFGRFIIFKGHPLNSEPFNGGSVFGAVVGSIVFYFISRWWLRHEKRRKEKIQNNMSNEES